MYLNGAGLFKSALTLSVDFEQPFDATFEMLTRQCVLLSEYEDLDAWNWLSENNLHELPSIGNTPSSVAWLMLKTYIEEYEQENMTILHKIVCQKIIRMGGYVPQWLLTSYKVSPTTGNSLCYLSLCRNGIHRNYCVYTSSMED